MGGIRRALVLCLVLIAGTAVVQAPSCRECVKFNYLPETQGPKQGSYRGQIEGTIV